MNKTQKIKNATNKARKQNTKQTLKKIILFPITLCKKIWNWLKSIDIVGMINLTLLVAIIILFMSLISDFTCCNKCKKHTASGNKQQIVSVAKKTNANNNRKVIERKYSTTLPVRMDKQTGITPKIRTVGVKKPEIIREISVPANELPKKQVLSGDVIIEMYHAEPILQNGVKVNGNLFIQNVRKYTLPCDAHINGNLFIRNVNRLNFCGKFTVKGNVYVNRESSFGPIPEQARIYGNIIL
nr:hypothetical protein [Candidatus Enterousia merdequi]